VKRNRNRKRQQVADGTRERANLAVESFNDIPLRRALFRGYRASDVRLVTAYWRAAMDRLESEVRHAAERATELEVELRILRTRLEEYVRRETEVKKALADVEARAVEVEADAKARAREVVREAEEHAARLRSEALARLTRTGEELERLLAARESFVTSIRAALDQIEPALRGVEAAPARPQPSATAPEQTAPAPEQAEETSDVGETAPLAEELRRRAVEGDERERVYEGRVELDVGPFDDFGELSSFARTIRRIPGVVDVDVGAFADDRATLGLTLGAPVVLGRALAETVPSVFRIDAAEERRLAITLAADVPRSEP
jgi:DNA repair exonuclease SbcCD ATPase subunit